MDHRFSPDSNMKNQYADEAKGRWPEEFQTSEKNLGKLSAFEQEALFQRGEAITKTMAAVFLAKAEPNSDACQAIVANHFNWIAAFWQPNQTSYIGLGEMYLQDPRFMAHYEDYAPGLAAYMCAAMRFFAEANL